MCMCMYMYIHMYQPASKSSKSIQTYSRPKKRLSFADQIRVSIECGRPRCGTGPKLQRRFAVAEASERGLPGAHSTGHLRYMTRSWNDHRI